MQDKNLEDRRYILQTRDGDYVSKVSSTGLETSKVHFRFTKDKEKAEVFSNDDLYSPLATTPIGISFMCGFTSGRQIRVL